MGGGTCESKREAEEEGVREWPGDGEGGGEGKVKEDEVKR